MSAPRPLPPELLRPGLIGLFVQRPILTLMIVLATTMVGVIAFGRLPLRFAPAGVTENQLSCWIPMPNARSPQEVQEKVVEPLAELVKTIPGLKRIRTGAMRSGGRVSVRLDDGIDPSLAAAELRDRIQRAMLVWPPGVDRYFTWKEDASSAPLAFVQFLTPAQDADWNYKLDTIVRQRIEAIDGVGRLDLWGLLQDSIRIWFDREKLLEHQVDFRAVMRQLQTGNFALPVGELQVEQGRASWLVRVDSKFHRTEDIAALPIRPGLVLGDVAIVERRPSVQNELSRFDRKYTCMGMVRAAAEANPVATSRALRAAIAELVADPRLQGLDSRFLFDQGEYIEDGLHNLIETAVEGGLLALLVLWAFLRNWAMTAAIALAIPLALLVTGSQMFFAGMSLDICTMAGMTLAVGMVVDNSVVVLENVRRMRELGLPLAQACVAGAREVGMAVTMSTLSSVVVFLPMAFLGSQASRALMGAVCIPLSTALVASLLVALLLMPSGLNALGHSSRIVAAGFGRWSPLRLILEMNRVLLQFGLRRRLLTTLLGIGLLFTAMVATKLLEVGGGGDDPFRRGDVTIFLTWPRGTDLPEAEQRFLVYEDYVMAHAAEWGVQNVGGRFGRRNARVELFRGKGNELDRPAAEALKQRVLANWPAFPGVRIDLGERGNRGMQGRSDESEKDDRNFVVRLWGRDSEYLMARAVELQRRLHQLPQVQEVDVPAIEDNQEIVVDIDRKRLQDLGVEPQRVLGSLTSGLQGMDVGRYEEAEREVRLIAQFDAREKPSLQDLKETRVFGRGGSFQRLSDLAHIEFQQTLTEIEGQDSRVNVVLVGKRKDGISVRTMSEALKEVMRTFPLERGYEWSEESVHRQQEDDIGELLSSMGLSIVLVFLLMGVLFESVILPLSILVTIPFALFGATWSLAIFHGKVDPMAIIGMVILCGVVVNNGIVLLDYVQRLRRSGLSRSEAILEGVAVRMRPIFMTAATTCTGLLPMAIFGDAGEGISYVGLSIAVAGGLAFSTVFTAIAVPLAYTFTDDFASGLRKLLQRALRPRGAAR